MVVRGALRCLPAALPPNANAPNHLLGRQTAVPCADLPPAILPPYRHPLQLLYEGDSAEWTAADFGRPASLALSDATCSRSSSSSVHRSPRSLLEGLSLGHSMASLSSGAVVWCGGAAPLRCCCTLHAPCCTIASRHAALIRATV